MCKVKLLFINKRIVPIKVNVKCNLIIKILYIGYTQNFGSQVGSEPTLSSLKLYYKVLYLWNLIKKIANQIVIVLSGFVNTFLIFKGLGSKRKKGLERIISKIWRTVNEITRMEKSKCSPGSLTHSTKHNWLKVNYFTSI